MLRQDWMYKNDRSYFNWIAKLYEQKDKTHYFIFQYIWVIFSKLKFHKFFSLKNINPKEPSKILLIIHRAKPHRKSEQNFPIFKNVFFPLCWHSLYWNYLPRVLPQKLIFLSKHHYVDNLIFKSKNEVFAHKKSKNLQVNNINFSLFWSKSCSFYQNKSCIVLVIFSFWHRWNFFGKPILRAVNERKQIRKKYIFLHQMSTEQKQLTRSNSFKRIPNDFFLQTWKTLVILITQLKVKRSK